MGLWEFVASTHPVMRAAVVAAVAFVGVELFKPGFAFAQLGPNDYVERGFMKNLTIDLGGDQGQEETIIKGTWLPWWGVPLGAFAFFSLFV